MADMDMYSKLKRSEIMSHVKGHDTRPELVLRKYLFQLGFRYRVNVSFLPGKPDIVLPKYNTIIFVHGCFWHGHENCKSATIPKSNVEFWTNKISRNKSRDKKNYKALKELGWRVIIIWECSLSNDKKRQAAFAKLIKKLQIKKL